METEQKAQRTVYADLLRCFAAFCVIWLHVAAGQWYSFGVQDSTWKIFNLQDALVRWTVPVFIMLSGAFMLDPDKPLPARKLWGKYILRIAAAFVFWALFYSFYTTLRDYFQTYGHIYAMHRSGEMTDFTFQYHLKTKFWPTVWGAVPNAFTNYYVHLWYMFVIAGLYLITPVIRPLTRPENKKLIEYFLLLWFLTTILIPSICDWTGFLGVQNYIAKFNISYCVGYVGYFVAGYYLKTFELSKVKSIILIALGAVGAFMTYWLTDFFSVKAGGQTETFYSNLSLNVMLAAVGIFTLFKTVFRNITLKGFGAKLVKEVSACTFGIYLVHLLFVSILENHGFSNTVIPPLLAVPLKTIIVFLVSLGVAAVIRRIPVVGKYIA